MVPAIFYHPAHLSVLMSLQNNPELDQYSLQSIHEILLNISACLEYPNRYLNPGTISWSYLESNLFSIIELLMKICGNFLISDNTQSAFYDLVHKCQILKKLIEILINKKPFYSRILPTLIWLSAKLISHANFSSYSKRDDPLYQTFVLLVF